MKRIGKTVLFVIILLIYIAIVCFGVMAVISKDESATIQIVQKQCILKAMMNQECERTLLVEQTRKWCEEQLQQERKINAYIDEAMEKLSIEQKLAQMMILTNEHDIHSANLQTYQPAGVIFFEVDFRGKTIDEVKNRVNMLQSFVEIPLLVGVDEEGGAVSRLKTLKEEGMPKFASARQLTEQGGDAIAQDTLQKMSYLKRIGINLNFAPVADVVDQKNSYMYERAPSGDADEAADYVESVINVMEKEGVLSCVKHFPGYGNNVNTHDGFAHDNRPLTQYEARDFVPFQRGVEKGVDMVMVSHIVMEAVDGMHPASLSVPVHEILRNNMQYDGVIIADDLNMQAILKTMTMREASAKALLAGNDMIFSADFSVSMQGALEAYRKGELTEEQINESVRRVLRMKIKNGIIEIH
ncbi:MAG: beta-hexosaminidase [Lachnospiraceae bacterium]|nr:beta-hexosaminidase [Lachnospiraceae bacterium]